MQGQANELGRELDARIQQLAHELLPRGYREGRYWRIGSVAGDEGQSLAIKLWGEGQGRWRDYSAGEGGDGLDLVAHVRCNGDILTAMDWARAWLRLPEREKRPDNAGRPRRSSPEDVERRRNDARRLWLSAKVLQPGDPVWLYLRSRRIDLALLPRLPGALRFHPKLWHPYEKRFWPAMVAAITAPDGSHCATHCTWLEGRDLAFEDAPTFGKAPIGRTAKMSFGTYAGGCIRLAWGASNKPWAQMPAGETLLTGEGIEDVLSGMLRWPQWRGACAVALSSMLSLELPPAVRAIRILRQNDAPGSSAAKLLRKVINRFKHQDKDREVYTWPPPVFAKDINETLTHPRIVWRLPAEARLDVGENV